MKLEIPCPMTLDEIAKHNNFDPELLITEIRNAHRDGQIVAIMDDPDGKNGCLWARKSK